ncbi:thiol reductant ABC exporter subunit CydD [Iamia majanohamensis]|uniref:Thiol reductant ABC exporter subunit CydD n=1 Tax=Iamia majanohamensis TaxID=467976 RepID=A0AAE9Y543_9ACTN|nr:thiol reductant ABC exporter subunit CydD [Iamia majanohamensis]WCO66552.1 thiol reductant ABC exporter subunit CydD [Iamia majanohamensis]
MAAPVPHRGGPLDRRVLGLSGALRTHLLVSGAAAVAVAVAVLVQAEAVSRLLPELVDGRGAAVAPLVAALVVVALVRGAAAAVTDRSATRALLATRTSVRRRVLDRLLALRPEARAHLGPGRVAALSGPALDALDPWVRAYLPALVLAVVVPLAAGARILGADPVSAAVLLAVVPLVPLFMVLIGRATEVQAAGRWEALRRLGDRFLDTLEGMPTLRLFGRADGQAERIRAVTEQYRRTTLRTLRVAFLSALVLELLATLSVALVAVSLGVRLTEGGIDLGTALLVLVLAPECLLPLRRVGAAHHAAASGTDAADEVHRALALPTVAEGREAVPGPAPLVAAGVTVADPARGTRLAPTDLRVAPGELVAVTGPSGAGKSTLLDVLRGALAPDRGTVHLGRVDVTALPLTARAAALAWVPQAPHAPGATAADAAALGHPDGPVTEAAVALALDQLGLAPVAGQAPRTLSGGQRRRLALARALVGVRLGTVRHLLVDEPTAQLDDASAAAVVAALRGAADAGVGVVVATHDPAVVGAVDREVGLVGSVPAARVGAAASPAPNPPTPTPTRAGATDGTAPLPVTSGAAPVGTVRWLLRLARPRAGRFAAAHALGVAAEACTVGLAGTAAWLVVRAAERPSFASLAVAAVAVRAFGLGKGVLRYGERLASHDATLLLLADLRATVVRRLARLSPTGLGRDPHGDLLTRLVDDVDRLQDLFLRVLGPVVSVLVVAAGAVAVAAVLDPAAGAALAVGVAVVGLVLPAVTHRAARRRGVAVATARGAVAAAAVDLAEHAEELVACGGVARWRDQVEARARDLDGHERAQGRTSAAIAAIAAGAPALGTAAVVAAAGPAGGDVSGPVLGLLVLLPLAVLELAATLAPAGDVLARVEASAERVRALLGRPDPVPEAVHPAPPPDRGDLDVEGVALAWPGTAPRVAGVDLRVAEGERVVVRGPSGSGKSTVAAGLVRFLPPTAGTYAVGGAPAGDLGGEGVRRTVTWCPQDPWFADSTLADNLRIARPDATDEEMWDALAVVHLDRWARALPHGLATRLDRDASAMSGGERQRLALARALLGGQRAVVLDEPTSHLDGPTASAVLGDLLHATRDRAVVLIAHGTEGAGLGREHRVVPTPRGPARWDTTVDDTPAGDPGTPTS